MPVHIRPCKLTPPAPCCPAVLPRRELACLTMTPSEAVMAGNVKFSNLGLESEADSTQAAAQAAPDAAPAAGTTA